MIITIFERIRKFRKTKKFLIRILFNLFFASCRYVKAEMKAVNNHFPSNSIKETFSNFSIFSEGVSYEGILLINFSHVLRSYEIRICVLFPFSLFEIEINAT